MHMGDFLIGFGVCMIATWRISYMLVHETGPFALFVHLRQRLPLGGLLTCMYCVSVWTALGLWALWWSPARDVVIILALSGGALMLGAQTGANYRGQHG